MSDTMRKPVEQHESRISTAGSRSEEISQQIWSGREVLQLSDAYKTHSAGAEQLNAHSMDRSTSRSTESQELTNARTKLVGRLDQTFGKYDAAGFRDSLRQFETRAWANGISKTEIGQTYAQIERVLQADGNEPLTPELRKEVVRDMIRNCAHPEFISQGSHNTCNVTTIEVRTYSLHPSKAAKLVADVATTGLYTTQDGIKVKIDAESMKPDSEAKSGDSLNGERAYATQLFNLAAVNVWYSAVKPGTHYEQQLKVDHGKEAVQERIIDYSSGKPQAVLDPVTKQPLESPYLSADQIAFISDKIVGKHEPYAVLSFGSKSLYLPGEKKQSTRAIDVQDESDLQRILARLKHQHQLPAIAAVDTNVDPLNADSGCGLFGPGGGHVVNVTDFAGGKQPRVSLDNQWSVKEDHPNDSVSMHDLYLCMGGSDVARLDAYCSADDAHTKGKSDPVSELRVLRFDGPKAVLTDYAHEAGDAVVRLARNERKLTGAERENWMNTITTIVNTVPAADKVTLLKRIDGAKVCSYKELGTLIGNAAQSISLGKKEAIRSGDTTAKLHAIQATTDVASYLITLPGEVKKYYFAKLRGE
jgi:hypothetical protein